MKSIRVLLKIPLVVGCLLLSWLSLSGAPVSLEENLHRVSLWMEGHRLLGSHGILAAEIFSVEDTDYQVHLFRLAPAGHVIANSDTRLPLAVAFSDRSELSLVPEAGNTLRMFLIQHLTASAERLACLDAEKTPAARALGFEAPAASEVEVFVEPMLETRWDQHHPYNLFMPPVNNGSDYFGHRAPTGCVATAYAQVLYFHRWPVHGFGSHTFTDTAGDSTGTHSADFSSPYDWKNMRLGYSAFSETPEDEQRAVARLMYDLAVAKEANFGSGGTSACTLFLGGQLGRHFYFEEAVRLLTDNPDRELALQEDLLAGYPVVASIPGHAVVADGLWIEQNETHYHINYGWGGVNDGWWKADGIPGGPLRQVVAGVRPALMAFPMDDLVETFENSLTELNWILPKRREGEMEALLLYQKVEHQRLWNWLEEEAGFASGNGWSLQDGVWFAGPNGPTWLDLAETFIPDSTTVLRFLVRYHLAGATFQVGVSTDDGATFATVWSRNHNQSLTWQEESVALGAFAGQSIRLRFGLTSGSFFSNGGVWLQDVSMNPASWSNWMFWHREPGPGSRRFSSETTVWDPAGDFSIFAKTSTSSFKDWVITPVEDGGHAFFKEPGGYSNREYHLTSVSPITPCADTRLVLRARYRFAGDSFRVSISTDGGVGFVPLADFTGSAPWADIPVDIGSYAGMPVHIRLEYRVGSFFPDGGLWIQSVATEIVSHPELEGQPVHFFNLTPPETGTYEFAAVIEDRETRRHRLGPSFRLLVNPADTPVPTAAMGTPHAWLIEQGFADAGSSAAVFDAVELSDPNSRGIPLWADYVAGTNPHDPGSRFRVAISKSGESLPHLRWVGHAGRQYHVERSHNLRKNSWEEMAVIIPERDDQEMSFHLPSGLEGPVFFRVRVSLLR